MLNNFTSVIALHDNKDGHFQQLQFVVNALKNNYNIADINYIISSSYFVLNGTQRHNANVLINNLVNNNNVLIVAIGSKTISMAKYLKNKIIKQNKSVVLVYLMPAGKQNHSFVDLTFTNKLNHTNNNFVKVVGSITNTANVVSTINTADFKTQYNLKGNITTVLIGGNAKSIKLTKNAINDLISALVVVNKTTPTTFLVSTTRRTPQQLEHYIDNQLKHYNLVAVPFFYHQNSTITKNNYFNMLAVANHIVVTYESTSMLSEACGLPSSTKVFLFNSNNFSANRYNNFANYLLNNGYCYNINNFSLANNMQRNSLQNASLNIVLNSINKICDTKFT